MKRGVGALLLCGMFVLCLCWASSVEQASDEASTTEQASVSIHLEADGSGEYRTLAEAVANAPDGATVVLAPGVYQLAEPLLLGKPLSLVGTDMDQVEIVCSGENYVLGWSGDGVLRAAGISFRHEGESAADVLSAKRGVVSIERCRFSGGRALEDSDEIYGAGLILGGGASGLVSKCEILSNRAGVVVVDSKGALFEHNTIWENTGSGLCFAGDSEGIARENECSNNWLSGIFVGDSARPILEGNHSSGNRNCGIVYRNSTGGTAVENTCSGNNIGIAVADEAHPMLTSNEMVHNARAGIWYTGNAAGTASENDCLRNGVAGIYLDKTATPTVTGNRCTDNGNSGIAYWGNSGGIASRNECSGNNVGILVQAKANPDLTANNCHGNAAANVLDRR